MKIVKRSLAAVLAVALVGGLSLVAMSAQDDKKPQPVNDKCPITGKDINPKAVTTVEVGFC